MKKILTLCLTLILAIVACFSATGCAKELKGFDIDLAREVASVMGVSVRFKEIDWDLKETELENKNIDVVWNGFTYTEDRDNGYFDEDRNQQIGGLAFTEFYMENKQVAVVKKANVGSYTDNASFNGKAGCAEASSAGQTVIAEILGSSPAQLGKQLDVFTAVQAGTYDFGVVDASMASEYIVSENGAYHNELAVVDIAGVEKEYYAIAFKEGSNLVGVFNKILKDLYADGTAQRIAAEYSLDGVLYNGFESVDTTDFAFPTDGSYAEILEKGEIVIGYTIFAPMAFIPE